VDDEGIHTAEARPRLISVPSDIEAGNTACAALLG